MTLSESRKRSIGENYDREAAAYRSASGAQKGNLIRLLSLAEPRIRLLAPRTILDVGCGQGTAVAALRDFGLLEQAAYLGVDLSPGMIAIASQTYGAANISFEAGDAEALPAGDEFADLVLSIAMLHWLHQPALGLTPKKAFSEIYRVLKPGGLFAATLCGTGMALRFREIYHGAMKQHANATWFDPALYFEDPLGCFQLHDVIAYASDAGLAIELAQMHHRTVPFRNAEDYLAYVRAYGFNAYMAPIAETMREAVWAEVCAAFRAACGSGPFSDGLYTNYLLCWKAASK